MHSIVMTQSVAASSLTLPVWWCSFSSFGLHISTNPLFLDERDTQAWWHPKLQLQGLSGTSCQCSMFHNFPFLQLNAVVSVLWGAGQMTTVHSFYSDHPLVHHLMTASVEGNQPKTDVLDMGTKVFSSLGNQWENRLWATWGEESSVAQLFQANKFK